MRDYFLSAHFSERSQTFFFFDIDGPLMKGDHNLLLLFLSLSYSFLDLSHGVLPSTVPISNIPTNSVPRLKLKDGLDVRLKVLARPIAPIDSLYHKASVLSTLSLDLPGPWCGH